MSNPIMSQDNTSKATLVEVTDYEKAGKDEELQGLLTNDENAQVERCSSPIDPTPQPRGAIVLPENEYNEDEEDGNEPDHRDGCDRCHDRKKRKFCKRMKKLKKWYLKHRRSMWFDFLAGAFLLVFIPVIGALIALFGTGVMLYGCGLFIKGIGNLLTFGLLHRHCREDKPEEEQPQEPPIHTNNRFNHQYSQHGSPV